MTIKFITLNIWNGGQLFDAAIKFLKDENPDIAVFQEVYDGGSPSQEPRFRSMEVLHDALPDLKFSTFDGTIIDHGNGDLPWGNAVFSKFPIVGKNNVLFEGKVGDFDFVTRNDFQNVTQGMCGATIEIDGKKLDVYSIHGVWGTHGHDTPERTKMGATIINVLKGVSPLIIAGDTNLYPDTQFVKDVCENLKLTNIFGTELVTTFNMKYKDPEKTGYATSPVDMVMASPELTVVSKEMPLVDVSDHFPLKVIFEV